MNKLTSNLQKSNTIKLEEQTPVVVDKQIKNLDVYSKGSITMTELSYQHQNSDENASFKQYDQKFETIDIIKKQAKFEEILSETETEQESSNYQDKLPEIKEISDKLGTYVQSIDKKLLNVMNLQEGQYQQSYLNFIQVKDRELNQLLENLKQKNNEQTDKDKEIINLKKQILQLKRDQFEADQKRIKMQGKMKEAREIYQDIAKDKQFYVQKIADQRIDIKTLQKQLNDKDLEISNLKKQLTKNDNEHKEKALDLIKQIAYDQRPKMGKINIIIDDSKPEKPSDDFAFMTEPSIEEPLKTIEKVKSQISSRKKLQQDNQLFCPYTKNKKFEQFVSDLLELNLGDSRTQAEIVKFVSLIETFYVDKIQQMVIKQKLNEKNVRKQKGINAVKISKNREMEEIFFDAIQTTKKNISKRKSTNQGSFEGSIVKLNEFDVKKIKYEDFTKADKQAFLDIFVSNPSILKQIHDQIFKTESIDTGSQNEEVSLKSSTRSPLSRNQSQSVLHMKKSRNQDSGIFATPQLSTNLPPSSYRAAFNSQSQASLFTPKMDQSKNISPKNVNNVSFNINISREGASPYIMNQQPNYTFSKKFENKQKSSKTQSQEFEKEKTKNQDNSFSFDEKKLDQDSIDVAYKRQGLQKNTVSLPQLEKYKSQRFIDGSNDTLSSHSLSIMKQKISRNKSPLPLQVNARSKSSIRNTPTVLNSFQPASYLQGKNYVSLQPKSYKIPKMPQIGVQKLQPPVKKVPKLDLGNVMLDVVFENKQYYETNKKSDHTQLRASSNTDKKILTVSSGDSKNAAPITMIDTFSIENKDKSHDKPMYQSIIGKKINPSDLHLVSLSKIGSNDVHLQKPITNRGSQISILSQSRRQSQIIVPTLNSQRKKSFALKQ